MQEEQDFIIQELKAAEEAGAKSFTRSSSLKRTAIPIKTTIGS